MTASCITARAYVITHPEWGIFLGHFLGLGFWSKLEPAGQPTAPTFPTIGEAEGFMATWTSGRPAGVSLIPVNPDHGTYASAGACIAAGLEGWADRVTPSDLELAV